MAWSTRAWSPMTGRSSCSNRRRGSSHRSVRPRYGWWFASWYQTVVETLYRGLADNTVSKVIEALLRNDLILRTGPPPSNDQCDARPGRDARRRPRRGGTAAGRRCSPGCEANLVDRCGRRHRQVTSAKSVRPRCTVPVCQAGLPPGSGSPTWEPLPGRNGIWGRPRVDVAQQQPHLAHLGSPVHCPRGAPAGHPSGRAHGGAPGRSWWQDAPDLLLVEWPCPRCAADGWVRRAGRPRMRP